MDTKEIVALTEKWLNEIKDITVDYYAAFTSIDEVRQDYIRQKKRWYHTVLPYLMPLLFLLVVVIAFGIILHFVGCPNPIDIKFQELELTQRCSK